MPASSSSGGLSHSVRPRQAVHLPLTYVKINFIHS